MVHSHVGHSSCSSYLVISCPLIAVYDASGANVLLDDWYKGSSIPACHLHHETFPSNPLHTSKKPMTFHLPSSIILSFSKFTLIYLHLHTRSSNHGRVVKEVLDTDISYKIIPVNCCMSSATCERQVLNAGKPIIYTADFYFHHHFSKRCLRQPQMQYTNNLFHSDIASCIKYTVSKDGLSFPADLQKKFLNAALAPFYIFSLCISIPNHMKHPFALRDSCLLHIFHSSCCLRAACVSGTSTQ